MIKCVYCNVREAKSEFFCNDLCQSQWMLEYNETTVIKPLRLADAEKNPALLQFVSQDVWNKVEVEPWSWGNH